MKQGLEINKSGAPSSLRMVMAFVLHPKVNSIQLTLVISLILIAFYNNVFWSEILKIAADSQQNRFFLASIFLLLVAFINLCLSLVSFKYILKPSVILILLVATFAAYFMTTYGIIIDQSMVKNVLAIDVGDVAELLNVKMFYYLVVLGVIPSFLVLRSEIRYKPFVRELFMVLGGVLTSLVALVVVLVFFYKDYISLGKNYNYVRHLINPVSPIYEVASYAKRTVTSGKVVVRPIGEDARIIKPWQERGKKNLVILVVGEAARARNFSLNGYERKTNLFLEKEDVLSFTNTYSCGTVTTTSLPCMFSHFGRESFSDFKADRHEGLLDVLLHAGVQVLWRENNSGCKGVCKRVETEDMAGLRVADLCAAGECQDMILLQGLQKYINQIGSDAFIVLHQKGSYGPEYYRRSPPDFKAFVPECTTNQLQECRSEELLNAYDNTIIYTDYFLSQVIDLLKKNSDQFNVSMLYLSDYGESLGEKNIYLHGLPYIIAPDEQKHIPFILWLGDAFLKGNHIDKSCLQKKVDEKLSHDNLFPSVLGLMGIRTAMYNKELDIFADCRQ
ncbi:MAG: phosphoethanolamine--lipid A transferase [Desulfocapsaceae bacterium]|jgi:lipid A ethanolaminephosphotransferase|nr:phosphoethanolamine--lipid A transferase [Desulfocapsaceae bacterium]